MVAILKLVAAPLCMILSFLICGLLLTISFREKNKYKRTGWYLILVATLILFTLSLKPVSNLLVYSLESRYNAPSLETLSGLDIIVILGGGVSCSNERRQYPEASGVTYSRLFNGVNAFKQSKAKIMVLSGNGSNKIGETNAEVMKDLATRLGIPENKILIDTKSRNTMEHAIEMAKLFAPAQNKRIGVVTSALHMMRAEKCFKKVFGSSIIPIPANYTFTSFGCNVEDFIPSVEAFSTSNQALHEWVGMIWYAVRYKT